jgi:hypothetical protein
MSSNDKGLWETLQTWMPRLFLVAGAFSLIAAGNYGVSWLYDSVSFDSWIGLTVLLARLASLLGVAGLSARLVDRTARLGNLSRVVVGLALVFTLGLGTVALSLITYTLFGIAVLRTGTHPLIVGILLLGATVALSFGLFARAALPIGVVGTVAELGLVVTHVGIGYRLLTESASGDRSDLRPETAAE